MKLKGKELALLGALILILSVWALWPKEAGNTLTVTVDGETVVTEPLTRDGVYPVEGYGAFSLTVMVEDGQVRVEDSTCPDLICQNHAPISRTGEQIICLPGRVVVSVSGAEREVDAYAG